MKNRDTKFFQSHKETSAVNTPTVTKLTSTKFMLAEISRTEIFQIWMKV
jgi:hypothetical protein